MPPSNCCKNHNGHFDKKSKLINTNKEVPYMYIHVYGVYMYIFCTCIYSFRGHIYKLKNQLMHEYDVQKIISVI